MLRLGIDEAGKGPVIGPLILAGCLIDEETEKEFKKLGVRDSKELTPRRREFLAEKIKDMAETFEIIIISPSEIDKKNADGTKLNELEAIACAKIINRINKGYTKIHVAIDCPSVSPMKWKEFLLTKIENPATLEIVCEHKADKNHICVSAASIIAKDIREKEMSKLKEKYGDIIGSGYTSDPLTTRFLEKNGHKFNDDGIFRKTWATWKNAVQKREQKELLG